MPSNLYWKRRAAKRMYEYQKLADNVSDEISKSYIQATNYINNEIEKIFRAFQINGGLTEKEAEELLDKLPDKVSWNDLSAVINSISNPDKKQVFLSILSSPAYAFRIKRFEQLQKSIDSQMPKLARVEEALTKNHYITLADEAFNMNVFDIQKGTGIGFQFSQMPVSRINEILKNNWSGKLFSERIWGKTERINTELKKELLTGFLTGRSYNKTAKEIESAMAVGAMEARRLVRTESTYIANMAEMDSYKECDIDKYRYLATLDMRTSEICASLDGKEFEVSKASAGVNMPPMHPWCRSTTIAVIEGVTTDNLKRRARDPETGKTYKVPQDMTYEEWKKELDDEHGEGYADTRRKMVLNRTRDYKQYQEYLSVLGKANMPKSLDLFQEMKYNNIDNWDDLKYYYRNINGRPIEYVKIDRELEKLGITKKGKAYPLDDIEISVWNDHAEDRLLEWNMTKDDALKYKADAIAIMRRFPEPNTQWNYYSDDGVIGIRHSNGMVCTVICKDRFGNDTENILKVMKKWLK